MTKVFKELSIKDIGDILYFVSDNLQENSSYTNGISPFLTMQSLKALLEQKILSIAGSYENERLTGITILMYSNCISKDTSITLIYTTIDVDLLNFALQKCNTNCFNKQYSKVKVYVNEQQKTQILQNFLNACNFVYELTFDLQNGRFWDVYSYFYIEEHVGGKK